MSPLQRAFYETANALERLTNVSRLTDSNTSVAGSVERIQHVAETSPTIPTLMTSVAAAQEDIETAQAALDVQVEGIGDQIDEVETRTKRITTLQTLRASLLANMRQPVVATVLPTTTVNDASQLGAGYTLYAPCSATDPNLYDQRYTFSGGNWARAGLVLPADGLFIYSTRGGGVGGTGGSIRFATTSPDFEIYGTTSTNGIRIKCDGQYITPDGTDVVGASTGNRFTRITWGDGTDSNRKRRLYEIIHGSSNGPFGGIKCKPADAPERWPCPTGLRGMLHADSMGNTVIANDAERNASIMQPLPIASLREATGVADIWDSSVGSSGFVNAAGGSTFLTRVLTDVVAVNPDVIWEIGGLNDGTTITEAVRSWLTQVIANNPAVVIFMTGQFTMASVTSAPRSEEKRAVAAEFPQNVVYLDNVSVGATSPLSLTGTGWVFGTGRAAGNGGAANLVGDGNADLYRGSDNTHWSVAGANWFGFKMAREMLPAIDTLLAAQ